MDEPPTEAPAKDAAPPANAPAVRASCVRRLDMENVATFVRDELLAANRARPIVGVTSTFHSLEPLFDVEEFAHRLGDAASVVFLATGRATRALTAALPPRLDVFGGWIRVWWPRMTPHAEPADHPLFPVMDPASARIASFEIEHRLRTSARLASTETVKAVVRRVEADFAEIELNERRAVLRPLAMKRLHIRFFRDAFRTGQRVLVRPLRANADGTVEVEFLWQGPRRWDRLLSLLAVNDVVRARVVVPPFESREVGLHVEVLPGCVGVVPIHEIPADLQERPDLTLPGRVVLVRVVSFRAEPRRVELSMFDLPASRRPTMQYSLFEEGPLFLDDTAPHQAPPPPAESERQRFETELLDTRQKLAATTHDLAKARGQFELLLDLHKRDERTIDLQKERIHGLIEELRERRRDPERNEPKVVDEPDDAKATTILLARIERSVLDHSTEADRRARPPLRFRVGPRFIATLRGLEGVTEAKIVDVCAEVVLQVAEKKAGRVLHPLGDGAASAAARVRERDGAKAWRCAIQVKTPSARRLHWWRLTDGTIEFASVNKHDDFTIPG